MATKSVSPKKTTAPKMAPKASAPAALTGNGVMTVLEAASLDPEVRRRLVAADAYFRAERRGFAAGGELEDWVAAEAAVDSQLHQMRVA